MVQLRAMATTAGAAVGMTCSQLTRDAAAGCELIDETKAEHKNRCVASKSCFDLVTDTPSNLPLPSILSPVAARVRPTSHDQPSPLPRPASSSMPLMRVVDADGCGGGRRK